MYLLAAMIGFLSTLSLRRATTDAETSGIVTFISIHALLAESDIERYIYEGHNHTISIHALLAESDCGPLMPLRMRSDFYPRSPCGERLNSAYGALDGASISIHALLAESDSVNTADQEARKRLFLSTLSLRRATSEPPPARIGKSNFYPRSPCGERLNDAINGCNPDVISIHALLAESDVLQF